MAKGKVIIVAIMGSRDKAMSIMVWPIMISTGKVIFMVAGLIWIFDTG